MLSSTQYTPDDSAELESTTIATVSASSRGRLDQRSGGLPWVPWQENCRGSGRPSRRSGLETLILAISCASDVPTMAPQPDAASTDATAVTMTAARRTRLVPLHSPMPHDATRVSGMG